MRKLAWLVVVLLFLSGALFSVRYARQTTTMASPDAKMLLELSQLLLRHGPIRQAAEAVGYIRGGEESVDFALYASVGFAWLGILSFVVLVASQRRRLRSGYDYLSRSLRGSQLCRNCGSRFVASRSSVADAALFSWRSRAAT